MGRLGTDADQRHRRTEMNPGTLLPGHPTQGGDFSMSVALEKGSVSP